MFLDTGFNSVPTVLTNIYQNFIESAMKFYSYTKSLPFNKRPRSILLISKSSLYARPIVTTYCDHLW
jgi:hypothetical protein